jgi:predicted benzoate:H+ symporter BenE
MWLYDNWHKDRTNAWKAGVAWAVFNIVMGTFITVGKHELP